MREPPTQEELRKLFQYEPVTGLLTRKACTANRHTVGELVGTYGARGYLQVGIYSKKYPAHRVIWCWMTGSWPTHDIDHINRDRSDNRWKNLRSVTRSENNHNAGLSRRNTSGHTGVAWDKSRGKWMVSIRSNGSQKYLGRFDDLLTAIAAHEAAKRVHHPTAPNHG